MTYLKEKEKFQLSNLYYSIRKFENMSKLTLYNILLLLLLFNLFDTLYELLQNRLSQHALFEVGFLVGHLRI